MYFVEIGLLRNLLYTYYHLNTDLFVSLDWEVFVGFLEMRVDVEIRWEYLNCLC
jgi:hypothetical protein